jgi:short subunit dehydrogenase-like uncharacterized protein
MVGFGFLMITLSPVRWAIKKLFPQNATHPSRETLDAGFYKLRIVGEATNSAGHSTNAILKVNGHSDPGYSEVIFSSYI